MGRRSCENARAEPGQTLFWYIKRNGKPAQKQNECQNTVIYD
jgi:hypothetical protein